MKYDENDELLVKDIKEHFNEDKIKEWKRVKSSSNNGSRGACAGIVGFDIAQGRLYALNKSAICHGNVNGSTRDEGIVAHVTIPYTDKDKDFSQRSQSSLKRYPEGFLDAYYTWLTTKSPVKEVFLCPWDGQLLITRKDAPMARLMLAFILSRWTTEVINYAREINSFVEWYDKTGSFGLAVVLSSLAVKFTEFLSKKDYSTINGHITDLTEGLHGSHSPYSPVSMTIQNLVDVYLDTPLTLDPRNAHHKPANDPARSVGGVFDTYRAYKPRESLAHVITVNKLRPRDVFAVGTVTTQWGDSYDRFMVDSPEEIEAYNSKVREFLWEQVQQSVKQQEKKSA